MEEKEPFQTRDNTQVVESHLSRANSSDQFDEERRSNTRQASSDDTIVGEFLFFVLLRRQSRLREYCDFPTVLIRYSY